MKTIFSRATGGRAWMGRTLLAGLGLALAACSTTPTPPVATPGSPAGPTARSLAPVAPGTPAATVAEVQRRIAASEYDVHYQPAARAYQSPNRAQNLRATFARPGQYAVAPRQPAGAAPAWQVSWTLRGIGRAGQAGLPLAAAARTTQAAGQLRYATPSYDEVYDNTPAGVRQSFVLHQRPAGPGADSVRVQLALAAPGLRVLRQPGELRFAPRRGGAAVLAYGGLRCWDATGQPVAASLRLLPGDTLLTLAVADARATYPLTIDPLASTPGTTLESNQADARLGSSVAGAGDLNGDGYADLVAGAPNYDNGQADEGAVFVYYGAAGGLQTVTGNPAGAALRLESNQVSASLGSSVAGAGDLNGDGYADLAVGASFYNNGQPDEGGVFIYYGGASGLQTVAGNSAAAALRLESNQADANLGSSVAGAGDLNGDGYADLAAGAPNYDNEQTDEGAVFIYYGGASGLQTVAANPARAALRLESNQADAQLGSSVTGAGDLNGDGYADLVVGAPSYDNGQSNEGAAFIYYGGASGLQTVTGNPAAAALRLESNQASAQLGSSVAGAGDLTGDGYADLAVGAYLYDNGQTDEGGLFIYYGGASGLQTVSANPAAAALRLESNQATAQLGSSAAGAGDLDGDGYADLVVGAPAYDNGQSNEGAAFIYYGGAGGLQTVTGNPARAALLLESNQADAQLGNSVAGAGDLNGDGYADLVAGTYLYDNAQTDEGAVFVYYGAASGLQTVTGNIAGAALRLESNQADAQLGNSVTGAGDLNGDGYADFAVGAPGYDNGQSNEGAAFIYYGGANGLQTVTGNPAGAALLLESNQASTFLGSSVAGAGDLNGDGYADLAVGAYLYDNAQTDEGAVFIYYGGASGLQTVTGNIAGAALRLESNQASANLGYSIAGAGDLNGDGYADLVVGASNYDNGQSNEGAAFIYYGGASGLQTVAGNPAAAALLLESNQAGASLSYSMAGAGDLNGDGYADLAVGATGYGNGQASEGAVFIYYGGASGLQTVAGNPAAAALRLESNQANAYLGNGVARAGDLNGDGYADLAAGAPNYDNGQTDEGAVFIYYGGASGLQTVTGNPARAALLLESNQANALLGNSVTGAGDLNGDGYADLAVGAYFYDNGQASEGAAFVYYGGASGLQTVAGNPAAAALRLESNLASGVLGSSIAGAGDLNGDGYADLAVGAYACNLGQIGEGAAFIYYGGGSTGASNRDARMRLYNTDLSTLLSAGNRAASQFGLGLRAASPYGRGRARLVWETVRNGQPFSGDATITTSTQLTGHGPWTDLPAGTVTELKSLVSKAGYVTRLRARIEYANAALAAASPAAGTGGVGGQARYGPWQYLSAQQLGQSSSAATPLPVVLTAFAATAVGPAAVRLSWATASEKNSARFEVERSVDGQQFEQLGQVAAQGSKASPTAYAFRDSNYPGDTKLLYYRLRQVDLDGSASYSPVRAVTVGGKGELTVYPNPARTSVAVSGLTVGAPVEVCDAMGRVVARATAEATGTAQLALPAGLAPGVYIVRSGAQARRLTVE